MSWMQTPLFEMQRRLSSSSPSKLTQRTIFCEDELEELADESSPSAQGRALAGILLKNYMTSKEHQQAVKLANDWMSLNPEIRNKVKANSVNALGSSQKDVRLASAQVISKIATIELPKQQWEDLVQALLSFVVKPEANPS
eukprot:540786-Hanusia_phi.AAC.1